MNLLTLFVFHEPTLLTKLHTLYILYIRVYVVCIGKGGIFLKIVISNRSGVPIYEQIKNQIKEAILAEQLKEDDMLPSIRQLAKDLKVSVITTTRAYSDLEEEGFIVSVQGKGCYVLPQNKELAKESALRKIEQHLSEAISIAIRSNVTKEEFAEISEILYGEIDYEQ